MNQFKSIMNQFKSNTLRLYSRHVYSYFRDPDLKAWFANATPEKLAFVDEAYHICEQNYESGGDRVVECYYPADVEECFKTIQDVQNFCGLVVDQAANCRFEN
jgi:hypothetical protein